MKIERNKDVVYGEMDLELLHSFPSFPVFMGCTSQPAEEDILCDMNFWISRNSGMIQLNPVLELDVLYSEAHGSGAIGHLWNMHHEEFANFINSYGPNSILEIGGAHGILAKKYLSRKSASWTIVEPNPTCLPMDGVRVIKGFFDENFTIDHGVDAVVHSHVFEHIYHPSSFMQHLASFIKIGGKLFFSVPNIQVMLERKYTNALNFEHTLGLTDVYIEFFLKKYGFSIINKKQFMDDHSIFYAAERVSENIKNFLPDNLFNLNKSLYYEYIDHHVNLIKILNKKIENLNDVYLFGAHVFSQYLLAFGLDASKIVGVLDNDQKKWGKRLSGTNLSVSSPMILSGINCPKIILKAGVYNEEIKSDILKNINNSAVFLE